MPTMAFASAARTEPPGSCGMDPPAARTRRSVASSGFRSSWSIRGCVCRAGAGHWSSGKAMARRPRPLLPHGRIRTPIYDRLPRASVPAARDLQRMILQEAHAGLPVCLQSVRDAHAAPAADRAAVVGEPQAVAHRQLAPVARVAALLELVGPEDGGRGAD